ncbi:GNAT family N-acetyltransferase [Flavobacteriaceae bacterium 3-367]|uniref:GNAT family N-acetyltransferase n=1 Tax=Eudoraea algarum TaxID=3417568 RepID=UPI003274F52A
MQARLLKCTIKDAEQLAAISRKTFVDAFEKDNDPEDFKTYMDTAFSQDSLLRELKDPDVSFYFVYLHGCLAGYFKINENNAQTDIRDKTALELERIYVLSEYQGKKLGEWMLRQVSRLTSERGKTYLWLGVWEKNTGAIRFYEKHGFIKFGTHPYYIGKDRQIDWLMRLDTQ